MTIPDHSKDRFRTWLEQVTDCDADTVLDILWALDKACPELHSHERVREFYDELAESNEDMRGDRLYQQRIEEEYNSAAREAAREMEQMCEAIREVERILRSGL